MHVQMVGTGSILSDRISAQALWSMGGFFSTLLTGR